LGFFLKHRGDDGAQRQAGEADTVHDGDEGCELLQEQEQGEGVTMRELAAKDQGREARGEAVEVPRVVQEDRSGGQGVEEPLLMSALWDEEGATDLK